MKRILFVLLLFLFLVSACMPGNPTEQPSFIVENPVPTDEPVSQDPVEHAVMDQLATNLGLHITDIKVIDSDEVDFNDGCLGVDMPEMMCAQVITPGRVIVLEANDIQYEYHTSEDASRIQPATLALNWSRDGGIAGFCDRLTVFLSGEVYGTQCRSDNGRMGTFASLLTEDEQVRFFKWIEEYGTVELDASDPKGVSDGMSLLIDLYGTGRGKPGNPIQEEIFNWAQTIYRKLYE